MVRRDKISPTIKMELIYGLMAEAESGWLAAGGGKWKGRVICLKMGEWVSVFQFKP